MKKVLILLLLFISIATFSQDYEVGTNVTKSDLNATVYKNDSTASAIIIYDYGNAYFDKETWNLNIEFKRKIKILKKEGLKRGLVKIPIYTGGSSKESIKNITATTYNLDNGKFTTSKIDKSAIFEEVNDKWTIVKFVLPNVRVGSVITYGYKKETRYINKYQPWYFQHEDPTLYSEYNTSIPGNYQYHIRLVGSIPLKSKDDSIIGSCLDAGRGAYADCSVSKYIMTNIPAYKEEGFTTTPDNYMSRIEYEMSTIKYFDGRVEKITKTWNDVDKELRTDTDLGRQLRKKQNIKDIIPKEVTNIKNTLDKAKAIYRYVLGNYRWNGDFGRYDASVKRLTEDSGGNAFELNLLLHNLLKSENYQVSPILLSTRKNGLATKLYPILSDFNYLILQIEIDSKKYFLDATNPYQAFGEIPFYCLNQYGRLLDFKNNSEWIEISAPNYSTLQVGVKLSLNEENLLAGKIISNTNGYKSISKKKVFYENQKTYLEQLRSSFTFATINNHTVNSKKNNTKFSEEFNITLEDEIISDKIYLNPFLYKFYDQNPFKLEQRTYPIDFGYKQAFLYSLEINLGERLKVVELPEDTSLALPDKAGLITFSFKANEDKLSVFTRIKLDKAIYEVSFYDALKKFMSKIVEIQNNTVIVLEKK